MTDLRQQERALTHAAETVVAAKADVTRMQRELAHDIDALRSRWTGAGAMAFGRLHQSWQEKAARITAALGDFESSLRETERDNVTTDQARADAFAHHHARLGG